MANPLANIRQSPIRGGRDNQVLLRSVLTVSGTLGSGGTVSADPHSDIITCVYGGGTGLLTLTLPECVKGGIQAFVITAANVDGVSATAFNAAAGTATLATKDGGVLTNLGSGEKLSIWLLGEDR